MSADAPVAARRARGRPRDPAIDRAIFEAAVEVIADRGYANTTIGEIAKRAGVPKSTIYRRFGSRSELLLAAAREQIGQGSEAPDTGSLRGDLLLLVRKQAEAFERRNGVVQLSLAAVNDPELADVLRSLAVSRRDETRAVFDRAIERGEIPASVDVDLAIDLLRGIGWARFLERRPADSGLPEKVVDYLLLGLPNTPAA